MGTTYTGQRVQDTYQSIIKVSNNTNLTGTAKLLSDGFGNDTALFLSTTSLGIGVTPTFQFQTGSHAKIGGNLTIAGNLTVNGTTTIIDSTVIAIGDNMMEMAKDNVANTLDIGWYGTINSSGEKYVGMFYDASSGVAVPTFRIGLGTSEPGSTATWTTKGKLVIGALDASTGVFSGQVTIPATPSASTDAASKGYVDAQITAQDLDFSGTSGTGSVDLDSQTFAITGSTNEILTTASGQGIEIGIVTNPTLTGNVDIVGSLNVDSHIEVQAASGYGYMEIGGPSGGHIDLKKPFSDDYDLRLITGTDSEITASGILKLNASNTLNLTLNGANATFAGTVTAISFLGPLTGNVTGNVSGSSGSTTGNAATATALQNARTIGGVSFNGTANINLPGVNTAGNQDTSGNAATATKIASITNSNIVQLTSSQTLTNKTIDLDNNTVSNIEVDNLKSGVLDTDLSSVSGSDDTLASAKSIKTYVDAQITAEDLDIAGDSGTGAVDLNSQTFTIAGGTNVTTSVSGQTVTINSTGSIDGSGTANDVVMWQDSNTLTDAPIAISGNNATFAGNVNTTSGNLSIDGTGFFASTLTVSTSNSNILTLNRTTSAGGYMRFQNNGTDKFYIGSRGTVSGSGGTGYDIYAVGGNDIRFFPGTSLTLTLDTSANATFSGNVILGDDKNLDFGAATDFRIVHNSTTNVNHISSKLDRQLSLNANNVFITNQANTEVMARFIADAEVKLYYDNVQKFQTTSTGIEVSGTSSTFAGSVGIGITSTPPSPLTVVGTGVGSSGTIGIQGANAHVGFKNSSGTFRSWVGHFNAAGHGSDADLNLKTGYGSVGNIRFTADGDTTAAQMFLQGSTGNVGIGTTSPASLLHIQGSTFNRVETYFSGAYISGFKFSDLNGGIWYDAGADDLYLNANHANSQVILQSGGSTTMTLDASNNVGIGTTSPQSDARLHTYRNSTDAFNIFESSANKWVFGEAGGVCQVGGKYGTHPGIQINTSGNVGIGTASPANKLFVAASTAGDYAAFIENTNSTNGYGLLARTAHTGTSSYAFAARAGSSDIFVVRGDGRVGIGTTSPDGNLEVIASTVVSGASDSVNNVLIGLQAANRPTIILDTADTTYTNRTWNITNVGSAGSLFFGRNGLDVLVMKNDGKVGIGTTSPSAKLHIHHTSEEVLRIDSGNTGAIHFFENTTRRGILGYSNGSTIATGASAGDMVLRVEGSNKLHLSNSGSIALTVDTNENVGIGTSSPTSKFTIKASDNAYTGGINIIDADSTTKSAITHVNSQLFLSHNASADDLVISSSGATFAGDISLANLKSIYLGTSSALRIYTDSAVGFLRGDDVRLVNAAGENIFRVNGDIAELYHNDIKKLETTSTGVSVTGGATFAGTINDLTLSSGSIATNTSNNFALNTPNSLRINIDSNNSATDQIFAIGHNQTAVDNSNNVLFSLLENGLATFAGDVVIGTSTTTPSTHFNNLVIEDVAGNNVGISLISGTGNNTALYFGDSADTDVGQLKYSHATNDMSFVTNAATAMTIDSSQNIGIGTTSPAQPLSVHGNFLVRTTNANGNKNRMQCIVGGSSDAANLYLYHGNSGDGTVSVRINAQGDSYFNGGNVGIGKTTSLGSHALSIKKVSNQQIGCYYDETNFAAFGAKSNGDVQIYGWNGSSIRNILLCADGSAVGGKVGIKNISPGYELDVTGQIRASDDIIAFSDIRVKENVKTLENSLSKVNKLRGVEFNKIGKQNKSIGVIAQEIEKILPEVVHTDDEGMKSVAYGNITGLLIEAVKELKAEIEELKKQIK